MQFAAPQLLWLIPVLVPAMIAFFWWSGRRRRQLLTAFIHARLLPNLLAGVSEGRRRFSAACLISAVCLLVVALARPQWGFTWEEVKQRGLDIVVAIDISKSMLAQDISPNRLARAKLAALDLMQRAKTDRLGLVAFAGSGFLQCPLTIDDAVFRQSVETLDVQSVSRGGTAISEAIHAAMSAFAEGENHKALVLLTDGEDHDSGALETARQAAAKGLEIFTIGIGTTEGEMVQVKDAKGKTDFVRDEQGNVVKTRLDETILRELAGVSQRGFYLPLRGATTIDTLYEKGLAPIPKTEGAEKFVKRFHDRYHWPLGAAILLLIVEMLYPERKRVTTPSLPRQPAVASVSKAAIVALLLCCATALYASTGAASKAYDEGDYEKALREYQQEIRKRKGKNDPRLNFNAGAAAYKNHQLEEAALQFNEALSSRDTNLQQRAFYNRGNTLYALGEASPDPKNKTEAWQRSIKDFESALKLDPKDKDAEFNRDFVKKRLEELQQQQQKQDKNEKQEDQKDQKDQKQEQQNQQDQQDQKQQDQNQQDQNQQQQKPQDQQQEDKKPQSEKDQQNQDNQQEKQQPKKPQQQQPDKKEDGQPQKNEQQQASAAQGQMTPEQARQLLDAQKGEEKILQFKQEEKPADPNQPIKDW